MADTESNDTVVLQAGGWADEKPKQQPVQQPATDGPVRTPEKIAADASAMVSLIEQRNQERGSNLWWHAAMSLPTNYAK